MKINSIAAYQPQMTANNNQKVNQNKTNIQNFNGAYKIAGGMSELSDINASLFKALNNKVIYGLNTFFSKLGDKLSMLVLTNDDARHNFDINYYKENTQVTIPAETVKKAIEGNDFDVERGMVISQKNKIAEELSIKLLNAKSAEETGTILNQNNLPIRDKINNFFYQAYEIYCIGSASDSINIAKMPFEEYKLSLSQMVLINPEEKKAFENASSDDDTPLTVLFKYFMSEGMGRTAQGIESIKNNPYFFRIFKDPKQLRAALIEASKQGK